MWMGPATYGGHELGARFNGYPCSGSITSLFGVTDWAHPAPHSGLDIGPDLPAIDVPVLAPAPGAVRFVSHADDGSWGRTFGNSVIIDHDDGFCSLLAHMRDLPLVAQGARVERGAMLGYAGATGQAYGVHVHWGLSTQLNPWFQKEADGGVARLLDPLDYVAAADPASPAPPAPGLTIKQQLAALVAQLPE